MRRSQENIKGSTSNENILREKNKEARELEKFLEINDSRSKNVVQDKI